MSLVAWATLGVLVGVIATQVSEPRSHWVLSPLLGLVGAILGGSIVAMSGDANVTGLDPLSLLSAIVGAIAAVAIHRVRQREGRIY